jgi:TetR/AcrR family transcriptional repressor of nem operon
VRSSNEIENAVSAATELFWSKGFNDTSMQDVVEATGFNRYALYTSFNSKRDLFLAALDAYVQFGKSRFEASLEAEPDSVIAALRHFVHGMLETAADGKAGCLLCNVATEIAQEDPEIAARVRVYFEEIEDIFTTVFERAAESGELRAGLSPALAAKLMLNTELGLNTRARVGADADELKAAAEATFAALAAD